MLAEQAGRFLRTLKNVYSGIFAQYANFGWSPSTHDPPLARRPVIDRWMISRLAGLERAVDAALEAYDATTAARAIIEFVDDDLANWYVRLNRARFYDVDADDNRAAFATLHDVLVSVCRLLAPFAPFVSDWIHRELTGELGASGAVRDRPAGRAAMTQSRCRDERDADAGAAGARGARGDRDQGAAAAGADGVRGAGRIGCGT